jgi:hypothetical protein
MTTRFETLSARMGRRFQNHLQRASAVAVLSLWLSSTVADAAVIKSVTLGPVFAVRGDLVTMAVEPSTPDAKVEWWHAGDVICESSRCEFDTSEFSPGEYVYHAVVKNPSGVEIAEISISTEGAPPLYKPKKLNQLKTGPNKRASFVETGKWLMIPRQGFISTPKRVASRKTTVIDFAEKPMGDHRYQVSRDGLVILQRVGHQEAWIMLGGSIFKFEQDRVSIVSGTAVWRKALISADGSQMAKVFGLGVEAQSGQLLLASSKGVDESSNRPRLQNLQGPSLRVQCPGEKDVQLLEKTQIDLVESIRCRLTIPEAWDGVEPLLSKTFPWWTHDLEKSSMDRWRMEASAFNLFAKGDPLTENSINEAFASGRCADVLDLSSRFVAPSSDVTLMRARCQFTFGMQKESMKNLKLLELKKFNPPMVAFLMARLHHQSDELKRALDWYKEANARGFDDRPNLGRYAVAAARDAGMAREQLAWLDTVALTENDLTKVPTAVQNASQWRDRRPMGASLEVATLMDSQAVPVNSKEISPMPNNMKASSAVVASIDGEWWFNRPVAKNASVLFGGNHFLRYPTGVRQLPYAVGKHDIRLGLEVDGRKQVSEPQEVPQGWTLTPSAVLGVGMLGSFRVRERFGWEMKASYHQDKVYSVTFKSDKYLDPAPGGIDMVDIDLYRLTVPGDFSHIDNVLHGEIAGSSQQLSWSVGLDLGRIDYRLPESIGFDHDLARLNFSLNYRLSPAVLFEFSPKYTSRNYYNVSAQETCVELESAMGWRPIPLWMGKILIGYENRRVSNDPVSSWTRQIYGVSVLTDI